MTSIYEKKISAEVRLTHAEQMSLYCCFSYAEAWELTNLFVGTKTFNYHVCYDWHLCFEPAGKSSRQVEAKVLRLFSARTEQFAGKEHSSWLQGLKENLKNGI